MLGIYFSGTGNTKYCIETFMKNIGGEYKLYSIEDDNINDAIKSDNEIIFAYPVYFSNMPKIVHDFINERGYMFEKKKIFVMTTMSTFSGDGAGCGARLLKKYGAFITGGLHIKMPNCIGDIKSRVKSDEENIATIRAATDMLYDAAKAYTEGKPAKDGLSFFAHIAGLFGQRLWCGGKTKHYYGGIKRQQELCVGCGRCVRMCPMKNIKISDKKAVSADKCTMCYRCMSFCARKAVTILGNEVVKPYHVDDYIKVIKEKR